MITLYHGTDRKNLKRVLSKGLEPSEGWGGAGTFGVYLAKTPEGALYWAKIVFMTNKEEKAEAVRFDRKYGKDVRQLLAIVSVSIPDEFEKNLRADMEQAEDVGFEGEEDDWRASLEEIGDAMYDGSVPAAWVKEVEIPRVEARDHDEPLENPVRRNSQDDEIRDLERRAAQGDERAQLKLQAIRARTGDTVAPILLSDEEEEKLGELLAWLEPGQNFDGLYTRRINEKRLAIETSLSAKYNMHQYSQRKAVPVWVELTGLLIKPWVSSRWYGKREEWFPGINGFPEALRYASRRYFRPNVRNELARRLAVAYEEELDRNAPEDSPLDGWVNKDADLRVYEAGNGYYIEDLRSGIVLGVGDGVDMFSGIDFRIQPGTRGFNRIMADWIKDGDMLREAYFEGRENPLSKEQEKFAKDWLKDTINKYRETMSDDDFVARQLTDDLYRRFGKSYPQDIVASIVAKTPRRIS